MMADPGEPSPAPMMRSQLAKMMYNKLLEDRAEQHREHSSWYRVDVELLAPDLCDKFIQFHEDMDTKQFLDNCYDKSDWLFTQLYHLMAKSFLGWFMNNTSINGFLGRGSMFVFSNSQFERLLEISPDWRAHSLLDLGAGDGKVTEVMARYFEEVYVTEASKPMIWKLQGLGYKVLDIPAWPGETYDVISCLNLLDRCDKPVAVLTDIRGALRPDTGRAIIAVVFPFRPYVEFSSHSGHVPEQYLHITGDSLEEQVSSFIHDVLEPLGFIVTAFTRLPYLCEGDMKHSFYVLNDIVFVVRVNGDRTGSETRVSDGVVTNSAPSGVSRDMDMSSVNSDSIKETETESESVGESLPSSSADLSSVHSKNVELSEEVQQLNERLIDCDISQQTREPIMSEQNGASSTRIVPGMKSERTVPCRVAKKVEEFEQTQQPASIMNQKQSHVLTSNDVDKR